MVRCRNGCRRRIVANSLRELEMEDRGRGREMSPDRGEGKAW